VKLLNRDCIGPVILNSNTELGSLDAKGGILGDKNGVLLLIQIETGCENPVIRCVGIEHRWQTIRRDAVELYPERAAVGDVNSISEPAFTRGAELFEEPYGRPGISADLVHPGLLPVELLNDDKWQHNIVFIKSE
jgi:hypothetical protein